jgi:hypothetical protein
MNAIRIDNIFDVFRDGLRDHLVFSEGSKGAVNVGPKFLNESGDWMSLLGFDVGGHSLDEYREKVNGV